jgi:hypothetical protein
MTNIHRHILLMMMVALSLSFPIHAQFINLQLRIEPELSASVEQHLDFGTQVTNSGRTEIQLGDVNMGVFSIKAYYTQNVYLSMQYPVALVNNAMEDETKIPIQLHMAYNNSGKNTIKNAIPLPVAGGLVSIHENTALQNKSDIWQEMFIYVYGTIDVGNIPNGVYTGDIVLSLDYD